jgi:hypothetical protein
VGINADIEGCDTIRVRDLLPLHIFLLIPGLTRDTRTTLASE